MYIIYISYITAPGAVLLSSLCIELLLTLQSRDCAQLGPPPPGEVVQVRWTDGLMYGAKFVATHVTQMYLVRTVSKQPQSEDLTKK